MSLGNMQPPLDVWVASNYFVYFSCRVAYLLHVFAVIYGS